MGTARNVLRFAGRAKLFSFLFLQKEISKAVLKALCPPSIAPSSSRRTTYARHHRAMHPQPLAGKPPAISYEIIVVDNNSS